ncbi:MAG TPA: hypothetical protein VFZ79_10935 [Acidimicrobiales bacterium]
MGCCHWHGPWCHGGCGYPLPDYGPPAYAPRRRRRGRWIPDEEDLEAYLADLEDEIAAVRRHLDARRSQASDA